MTKEWNNKKRNRAGASKDAASPSQEFLVFGYQCRIFRDDAKAVALESRLQPWGNKIDNPVLVDRSLSLFGFYLRVKDIYQIELKLHMISQLSKSTLVCLSLNFFLPTIRYDVRNLLDDLSIFKDSYHGDDSVEDKEETLCDMERYQDVDSDEELLFDMTDEERVQFLDRKKKRQLLETRGRAIGYDYNTGIVQQDESITISGIPSNENDKPPAEDIKFPPPHDIKGPTTKKLAEIIEKTAQFVNQSSNPQIEFLIQVRQGSNPDFAFMAPGHDLHPYYRFLREKLTTPVKDEHSTEGQHPTEPQADASVIEKKQDVLDNSQENIEVASVKHLVVAPLAPEQQVQETPKSPPIPQVTPTTIPPEEIVNVIEKLAGFVARNGLAFEAKVKEQNRNDPRFSFLLPWNSFHTYYTEKRDFYLRTLASHDSSSSAGGHVEEPAKVENVPNDEAAMESDEQKRLKLAKAKAFLTRLKAKRKAELASSSPRQEGHTVLGSSIQSEADPQAPIPSIITSTTEVLQLKSPPHPLSPYKEEASKIDYKRPRFS
ncbi:hypothetical protein DFS34DRAFT_595747 [Phlyctochytrium arcticum]|nr:hypothetical protein DFS34DRAFT_595747 [Phlyctochytrium arcticum]